MKFVVAPDSFKGSISSYDACLAIKRGIHKVLPNALVALKPIADGGEGTLDAIVASNCRIGVKVRGPYFEQLDSVYGYIEDVAVIEMACAAGLTLVPEEKKNAGQTTTYGVGELISSAISAGFRRIMLTVGGSATNDGGCGMLAALGARFIKKDGTEFVPVGDTLCEIEGLELSGIVKEFFECEFLIATDVKNPLLGEKGATFVYAPQKGLRDGQKEALEEGMAHLASVLKRISGKDVSCVEGCGAGGGISAPLLAFANAKIQSGIDTVLDVTDFSASLKDADAVITGEGKIDFQSLFGKAISGVAKKSFEKNIPVYCFVGCVGDDAEKLKTMGLADIYELSRIAKSAEDSIKNADKYLEMLAEDFVKDFLMKSRTQRE